MELIASGRDADVWALDAERVLRRYRNGRDMDREASVMRHAAAHGYPVVIDWSNATSGSSTLDVATSALILAEVAVGGLVDVPAATARELLEALLRVTGPADPVQLQAAVAGRTANPPSAPPRSPTSPRPPPSSSTPPATTRRPAPVS